MPDPTILRANGSVAITLAPYDIEKLAEYQARRKAEDYFEIEELLDLLDSIADDVVESDADEEDTDQPPPELYP